MDSLGLACNRRFTRGKRANRLQRITRVDRGQKVYPRSEEQTTCRESLAFENVKSLPMVNGFTRNYSYPNAYFDAVTLLRVNSFMHAGPEFRILILLTNGEGNAGYLKDAMISRRYVQKHRHL